MGKKQKQPRIVAGVWTWECSRCREYKPGFDFNRGTLRSGLNSWCRECNIEWKRDNAKSVRRSHVKYRKNNAGKVNKYSALWRKQNKIKKAAHRITEIAVKAGVIKVDMRCVRCGTTKDIVLHHEDYHSPLDVIPLCYRCHGARHAELKYEHAAQGSRQLSPALSGAAEKE
jgi:hypothetical protein